MYIYEGHMGGLYTSDKLLDYDELYCEECGDRDYYLGYFETKDCLRNILLDYYDYDKPYVYDEYWTEEEYKEYKKDILREVEEYVEKFAG